MSAHGAAWFTHRLDSWSKIAREKVKRAADLNNESPTNTSSDDGSPSATSIQKDKDAPKSASSSFEVNFYIFFFSHCVSLNFCVTLKEPYGKGSPLSSSPSPSIVLQHQSKSFPPRHLARTSSISSESSVENLQVCITSLYLNFGQSFLKASRTFFVKKSSNLCLQLQI